MEWQLFFHPDKCHIMHLGKKNMQADYQLGEGEDRSNLTATDKEKDLGVIIQNNLRFTAHIDKIINTANKILGIIRRTFDNINKDIFNHLYKGIVRPSLEYASSVYNPKLMGDIHRLESIQRRATKMVTAWVAKLGGNGFPLYEESTFVI